MKKPVCPRYPLLSPVFLLLLTSSLLAGPGNIAPSAKVSASSRFDDESSENNVVDGVLRIDGRGEWVCAGSATWWGTVSYPWIQLDWPEEQTIERMVIYDRPCLEEQTAGGILEFSNGDKIRVFAVPNNGSPKSISFPPKKARWVRFTVTDGIHKNLGLSEIEVFPTVDEDTDIVDCVDPYIETARGRWFFCTPGSRPFGMVSAAPYTRNKNQGGGGYNYNNTEILGFSQIHAWIMSGINLMPTTGGVDPTFGEEGWKSEFSHDGEIIQPGYQRLYLDAYATWVEMTSTDRVAFYRMTYTQAAEADILLSLGGWIGSVSMVGADVRKVSDTTLEGSVGTTDRLWGGPQLNRVFFVVEFDKPLKSLSGWKGQERLDEISELSVPIPEGRLGNSRRYLFKNLPEEQAGVAATFDVAAGDTIQAKIALSFTSIENARTNLRQEGNHWNFDTVRQEARQQWNEWLSKIAIRGGTREQRVKFYTDLWHTLLGRHKIDDANGDYPIYMGEKPSGRTTAGLRIGRLPRDSRGEPLFHMYNFDALWLTMWNLNVLWGLGWPGMQDEFSACLVQYADNGGLLPRGPSAGGYTFIMAGCPATSMITSAYQKNLLTKVDARHAYETIRRNHGQGGMLSYGNDEALAHYIEKGWSPGNAGTTVQWAFEDWALGQMAKDLGEYDDAERFSQRSQGWKSLYHQDIGLLMPRKKDGRWLHDDPLSGAGWVEANAWQGTFSVSHDISGLAELMGGNEKLCSKLNYSFEQAAPADFVFGYNKGHVSYANQPGCSNAHVFNHAGSPWLSQYWVRRVNEQAYGGTTPDAGYGGHDEDQGQMGGVSVLMSLGLFSLRGTCAKEPVYEITSPVFDEITIRLDPRYYSGKTFNIRTYNNAKSHVYIQKAALNGAPLEECWFAHRQFAEGGTLELWLGPEPNKTWGSRSLSKSLWP